MKRRLRSGEGDEISVRADINVTSLVDVAFTLLIIFMITAPILQGGIEVDVPEAASGPITATDALVISITSDGQVYLDDDPVSIEEFDAAIEALLERRESKDVLVKADQNNQYGRVVRVLGRLQEAGATVSLISAPETVRRP
ncbi:MAG: ExbD/TolR family protein [Gemmatimonadota bacterium]